MATTTRQTITAAQSARVLAAFIHYADKDGMIEARKVEFFGELARVVPSANDLDVLLHDLSTSGEVQYEEIGDEGFAPIIIAGCSSRTSARLAKHIEVMEAEIKDLRNRITGILTFDPDELKRQIDGARSELAAARSASANSELLRPLLGPIGKLESSFGGVAAVADKYEDVYRNIIRPVQLEGQSGVRATVKWAIFSIIVSTVISLALSNWKEMAEALGRLCK